jgi:hypothetical protein
MTANEWYQDILRAIPDFDLARCLWIMRFEVWEETGVRCCRLVLDYADRFDITLVVKGVSEMSQHGVSVTSVVPYTPYDLGEFLVADQPGAGRKILFDELKGWRIVGDSVLFAGVSDHVESRD